MNNNKRLLLFSVICIFSLYSVAQIPSGYYNSANGLTGTTLQQALHDIIDNHTVRTYANLWTDFQTTDKKPNGKVWDMYSDIPSGTPAYEFIFVTNQCGNYSAEGDCYNREHSFPKSWFGGEVLPMYTDLFHMVPTDGYVNNMRGNFPFGEVSSYTYKSSNGSMVGPSTVSGYSGTVFEPIDEYKGDFARSYFYMATRYYGDDTGWPGSDMVTGSQPKTWALAMLLTWHRNDPVSQKEIDRNNAVYGIQSNRNPYIDYPLYAEMIWGTLSSTDEKIDETCKLAVYPNPATTELHVILPEQVDGEVVIQVYDMGGCLVKTEIYEEQTPVVDVSDLNQGMYLLQATSGTKQYVSRFVIAR